MNLSGFPSVEGMDSWIDFGRDNGLLHQLMIAVPPKFARARRKEGFWLEFTDNAAQVIGWIRFEYLFTVRNQSMFAAKELRPASGQAPRPEAVWLDVSTPRQGAGEGDR